MSEDVGQQFKKLMLHLCLRFAGHTVRIEGLAPDVDVRSSLAFTPVEAERLLGQVILPDADSEDWLVGDHALGGPGREQCLQCGECRLCQFDAR